MPVTATRAVFRDLVGLRTRLKGLLATAPSRASHGRVGGRHASSCRVLGAERGVRPGYSQPKPGVCARVPKSTPVALPRRHTEIFTRARSSGGKVSVESPTCSNTEAEGLRERQDSDDGSEPLSSSKDRTTRKQTESTSEVQRRVVVTMLPNASIVCTADERKIFDTLLDVVKVYELPVTLRVAGGWVRDKLLGKNSSDIDIALDTCMGQDFANKVNEYLATKGEETRGVGVIQSNPEQSKHLETATMRVHGSWLDLVNLRSESYSEGSRIPEARFGTPTQDAERRDLTINALFYNISTDTVEDFTGKGLSDLQGGLIRTPLPPRTTFLDDPLRILRAVRFASRFGFALDDSIATAATDVTVQENLRTKVSRERVGKEVGGMLRGPSPGDALTLLCRFELFDAVFASALPSGAVPAQTSWGCLHATRALDAVLSAHANLDDSAGDAGNAHSASFFTTQLTGEEREWLCLASFLAPLHDGFVTNPSFVLEKEKEKDEEPTKKQQTKLGSKKTKHVPLVMVVVKEGLKMRNTDAETVWQILDTAGTMRGALFGPDAPSDVSSISRGTALGLSQIRQSLWRPDYVTLGRLLRRAKTKWRLALVLAAALEMPGVVTLGQGAELPPWAIELAKGPPCAVHLTGGGENGHGGGSPLHAFAATSLGASGPCRSDDNGKGVLVRSSADGLAKRVLEIEGLVQALDLNESWTTKPMLDGREIMQIAKCKGGPVMSSFSERLVDWGLEHRDGTKEQAAAFVAEIADQVKAEFAE